MLLGKIVKGHGRVDGALLPGADRARDVVHALLPAPALRPHKQATPLAFVLTVVSEFLLKWPFGKWKTVPKFAQVSRVGGLRATQARAEAAPTSRHAETHDEVVSGHDLKRGVLLRRRRVGAWRHKRSLRKNPWKSRRHDWGVLVYVPNQLVGNES